MEARNPHEADRRMQRRRVCDGIEDGVRPLVVAPQGHSPLFRHVNLLPLKEQHPERGTLRHRVMPDSRDQVMHILV